MFGQMQRTKHVQGQNVAERLEAAQVKMILLARYTSSVLWLCKPNKWD